MRVESTQETFDRAAHEIVRWNFLDVVVAHEAQDVVERAELAIELPLLGHASRVRLGSTLRQWEGEEPAGEECGERSASGGCYDAVSNDAQVDPAHHPLLSRRGDAQGTRARTHEPSRRPSGAIP